MSRYLDALHDLETAVEISETAKLPSVESVETPPAPPTAGSEISESAKSPSVESVETPAKKGLDTLDTTPNGPFSDFRAASQPATTDPKGAARAYYNHLMAQDRTHCGCRTNIGALVARFCPEGQRLRDRYTTAATGGTD
jgi:hypothetical protein